MGKLITAEDIPYKPDLTHVSNYRGKPTKHTFVKEMTIYDVLDEIMNLGDPSVVVDFLEEQWDTLDHHTDSRVTIHRSEEPGKGWIGQVFEIKESK